MSLVLRDDSHKYFLDWDRSVSKLQLTEWDYVHVGNKTVLQISSTYSVDMSPLGGAILGSWYDTTNQTAPVSGTATAMLCNSGSGNGITKLLNKNFQVTYSGTYNIQFSAQVDQSAGSGQHIIIWLRKNGVDEPYSAGEVSVQGSSAENVPCWNYLVHMNSGDYLTIMYSVTNTSVFLKSQAPTSVVPGIPSVIVTMWKL